MALAEFDLEQEALAAIGAGVLAQKFRRRVTQAKAARVSEQGTEHLLLNLSIAADRACVADKCSDFIALHPRGYVGN